MTVSVTRRVISTAFMTKQILETTFLQSNSMAVSPLSERPYPHFIKYMGSKSKIMGFVLDGINEVYKGGGICDLFAGSASIAGAIGNQVPVHSNDIQCYSGILADAYLNAYKTPRLPSSADLLGAAEQIVLRNQRRHGVIVDFSQLDSLDDFNEVEKSHQQLIHKSFQRDWHLFFKYYSGTWWSAEQCLWIDAIREVAEGYKDQPFFSAIISCLMYAMAYTSQGTGHYAQYRDAKTVSSMRDILIYRRRSISYYFTKKFDAIYQDLPSAKPAHAHTITSLDYRKCLERFSGGTVYADPPYCFVHYSRFYHAIETLVLYDYPAIQEMGGEIVKGRYREDRHQSPFCIKSKVRKSFEELFEGVLKSESSLVLSYSNTGMISIDEIGEIAKSVFRQRRMELLTTDHKHMTLGRQYDRDRDVEECLILIA